MIRMKSSVTVFRVLLVIVVIGIRKEPQTEELSEQAPSLIAMFVRRLLAPRPGCRGTPAARRRPGWTGRGSRIPAGSPAHARAAS